MKIHFQADADFNQIIISGVIRRKPSIDFKTADSTSLRILLEEARQENIMLRTSDGVKFILNVWV